MREIKFGGKQIDNGEWVYGDFVHHDGITDIHFQTGDGEAHSISVDPETVGQYTGLSDKNGKEIYEGDIVKTHYANTNNLNMIEEVVFWNGRFMAKSLGSRTNLWDGIKRVSFDKTVYMNSIEVIGNIHDNPELMEGGNGHS